jgi:hypothetical protein
MILEPSTMKKSYSLSRIFQASRSQAQNASYFEFFFIILRCIMHVYTTIIFLIFIILYNNTLMSAALGTLDGKNHNPIIANSQHNRKDFEYIRRLRSWIRQ